MSATSAWSCAARRRDELGGIDKLRPISGDGDMDHAKEAFGQLLISECDGAVVFQMTEETLDVVLPLVDRAVIIVLASAV